MEQVEQVWGMWIGGEEVQDGRCMRLLETSKVTVDAVRTVPRLIPRCARLCSYAHRLRDRNPIEKGKTAGDYIDTFEACYSREDHLLGIIDPIDSSGSLKREGDLSVELRRRALDDLICLSGPEEKFMVEERAKPPSRRKRRKVKR